MPSRRLPKPAMPAAGKLLVAHPSLRDPNFRHTVLYLTEHSLEDGAVGFVLNRPIANTRLGQLVQGDHPPKVGGIPVYWGGPVATNQLSIARIAWRSVAARVDFQNSLPIERAAAALEDPETSVRAFVGYSGWGAGQLEEEVAHKAWVVQDAAREHFEPESLPGLWATLVKKLGPLFELQANAPEDPSLN